jgi:hypothetical protein
VPTFPGRMPDMKFNLVGLWLANSLHFTFLRISFIISGGAVPAALTPQRITGSVKPRPWRPLPAGWVIYGLRCFSPSISAQFGQKLPDNRRRTDDLRKMIQTRAAPRKRPEPRFSGKKFQKFRCSLPGLRISDLPAAFGSHRRPSLVLRLEPVQQLLEGFFSCPTGHRHGLKIDRRLLYWVSLSGAINLPPELRSF